MPNLSESSDSVPSPIYYSTFPPPKTAQISQPLSSSAILSNPSITTNLLEAFKKAFKVLIKIKWKKITTYLTGAAALVYLIVSNPTFQNLVNHFFPNSSPILGRTISMQGVLKSSDIGIYSLVLPNQETYTIHFKPAASLTNLKRLNEVVVKGNLAWTPYVIENAEIYPLSLSTQDSPQDKPISLISQTAPSFPDLPKLFSGFIWESLEKRTLVFTSGKRKITVDGFHLESEILNKYPQDFLDYYTNVLQKDGWDQILDSKTPSERTLGFQREGLYLTAGIETLSKGKGDSKIISGYKAFLEHN